MAYVLLIRHGQNDWVNKNRLAGWIPGVRLNEEGRAQVEKLSQRLSAAPIKAIYSSPLERCMESAVALAQPHALEVVELPAVGEVDYGDWEGKKIKKLARKKRQWYAVQHYPSRFEFPGGESFRDVQQRAVSAIEQVSERHKEDLVTVVSHADVIKLVLAHYLGMHMDLFQRLAVSPASVSALFLSEAGVVRVLRINDDGPFRLPPQSKDKKAADEETLSDEQSESPVDGSAKTDTKEIHQDIFLDH
jgi:probable phosphoglycerate mutase